VDGCRTLATASACHDRKLFEDNGVAVDVDTANSEVIGVDINTHGPVADVRSYIRKGDGAQNRERNPENAFAIYPNPDR
jgi:hypothetical protein